MNYRVSLKSSEITSLLLWNFYVDFPFKSFLLRFLLVKSLNSATSMQFLTILLVFASRLDDFLQ